MTAGINTQGSNSQNINPNIDTSLPTTTPPPTESGTPPPIQDTSAAADDDYKPQPDYQKPSGKPGLPPPTGSLGTIDEAVIAQLFDPQQFMEFLKSSDTTPGPSTQQQKEEFAKIQVDDPEIVALAAQLGISPGEAQAKLRVTASVYFKQLIKDLPEEQQNKLIFARMNPDSANVDPEVKALLGKINQTIAKEIMLDATGYKFSAEWAGVKPDDSEFNDAVTVEFDAAFENNISKMELGEQITPQQALHLRTMHYMPGTFASDSALQSLFAKIEGSIIADVRAKYGAGADWTPKADGDYRNRTVDGFFRQNFQTQLNAYQPALTEAQKEEIMNLFANPSLAASSVEIDKIAKAIAAKSIAATIEKYGLESTWMPIIAPIISPNVNSPFFKTATDALATANSLFQKFSAMINGMPEGPIKSAYLDYLKTIGESLNKLQEFLYSLSSSDAASSKKLSKANMDTVLADIKRAQSQVDEAKAKEADTKKLDLGCLGDINSWVGQIVSLAISCAIAFSAAVIFTPAVGLLIVAVALAYFIDKAVASANGTTPLFTQMFTEINDAVGSTGGASAVTGLLSLAISSGNPFMCLSLVNDAKTVQNFIESCGGDKMAQEVGAAVFNGAAQVIIMVVLMAATGGTAAPAILAEITATVAKITHLSNKIVNTAIYLTSLAFTIAMGALQATQLGLQCKWEFVQAEIALILSKSEAASEAIKPLLKALRKLIDKLLEAMNGVSDDILFVSKQQGKKYDDVSAITAEIQG